MKKKKYGVIGIVGFLSILLMGVFTSCDTGPTFDTAAVFQSYTQAKEDIGALEAEVLGEQDTLSADEMPQLLAQVGTLAQQYQDQGTIVS